MAAKRMDILVNTKRQRANKDSKDITRIYQSSAYTIIHKICLDMFFFSNNFKKLLYIN